MSKLTRRKKPTGSTIDDRIAAIKKKELRLNIQKQILTLREQQKSLK